MNEIEKLARVIDPGISREAGHSDVDVVLRRSAQARNARETAERVLTHLRDNPPQCAVAAMRQATEWDQMEAIAAFTAALTASLEDK